jgi:hypothetical protein
MLAYRDITSQQFVQANQYQAFDLQFTALNPTHALEFRVYWYGQSYIKLKNVSLQLVSSIKARLLNNHKMVEKEPPTR